MHSVGFGMGLWVREICRLSLGVTTYAVGSTRVWLSGQIGLRESLLVGLLFAWRWVYGFHSDGIPDYAAKPSGRRAEVYTHTIAE